MKSAVSTRRMLSGFPRSRPKNARGPPGTKSEAPIRKYISYLKQSGRRLRNEGIVPKSAELAILFEGSRAECLARERHLRPHSDIAWNKRQGGIARPLHDYDRPSSTVRQTRRLAPMPPQLREFWSETWPDGIAHGFPRSRPKNARGPPGTKSEAPIRKYISYLKQSGRRLRNEGIVPKSAELAILFEGSRAECLARERHLRPHSDIAWNKRQGGIARPLHDYDRPSSTVRQTRRLAPMPPQLREFWSETWPDGIAQPMLEHFPLTVRQARRLTRMSPQLRKFWSETWN